VKNLATGEQVTIPRAELANKIQELLRGFREQR